MIAYQLAMKQVNANFEKSLVILFYLSQFISKI